MTKLEAAVIGCGSIANWAHLPTLRKIESVELSAVCDIVEEKARSAAERFGAQRAEVDYNRVLEDGDIDFVVIATPPDTHRKLTIDSLRSGKHVFLEKPMASNLDDALEIYRESKKRTEKLATGFCLRFHEFFKKVKELVDKGEIGRPVLMWRNAVGSALGVAAPASWVPIKKRSGGMLVENTVHTFDAFRWFAGECSSVDGYMRTMTPGVDIEDNVAAMMRFKNGCFATLTQTWTATHSWEAWGVVGMEGTVSVDGYIMGTMRTSRKGEQEHLVQAKEDPGLMYRREMESFVESVAQGKEVFADTLDGIKAQEIAVAIQKSASEGRRIELPLVSI